MLTKLTIRNFKQFDDVEIELGSPVVFVGPNNSGKTTALQALSLWSTGLRLWNAKRSGKTAPAKRPGVTVNRRDLVSVPVPGAKLLWRELHVREQRRVNGRQGTSNVRVEIVVEGATNEGEWRCGLEFDYANEESFYCRPLRLGDGNASSRMEVPPAAGEVRIAYLPPMSGLAATEPRLDPGAVDVRIGEGRTAEVLRNLCHRVHEDDEHPGRWDKLAKHMRSLFGVQVDPPKYNPALGEITMTYSEHGVPLDLSASGRGLQQTLLLLAYMYSNPGAVLLLDEPDAHMEILRQRQTYGLLTNTANETGSQIVAATHSEVVLNEAAGRDLVVAFVGSPHVVGGRRSQVAKALKEIGWEDYYQAKQTGWVLYVEGSTDLAILRTFAGRLQHDEARNALERPFVHYVGNQPGVAKRHFHGLREAVIGLRGVALFDQLDNRPDIHPIKCLMWDRREIENYLCSRETLQAFAQAEAGQDALHPLSSASETKQTERRLRAMRTAISDMETALKTLGKGSPWSADIKASDDFLIPLFQAYHEKLALPNLMAKRNFHVLAAHVPEQEIAPEVRQKLDAIARVAAGAYSSTPSISS